MLHRLSQPDSLVLILFVIDGMCIKEALNKMTIANILMPKSVRQPQEINLKWKRTSSYAEEYKLAFQAVDKQVMVSALQKKLLCAGITINQDEPITSRLKHYSVSLQRIERGGALMTYYVNIGPYQISVVLLNIQERVQSVKRKIVSKGTFGNVIEMVTEQQCFVAKRIYFRSGQRVLKHFSDGMEWQIQGNDDQLSHILSQFAFLKLCSALEIGAKAIPSIFDVVCYQDAVQYYMQKCQALSLAPSQVQKFEMRMMYCLKVLHTLHLVHKDIKPPNIMYSSQTKEFVLIDFGVSSYVEEPIGCCTQTFREGTAKFMSPEMRRIQSGCTGTIDLYYNDLYALRLTIDTLTRKSKISGNVWETPAKKAEPIEEDVILTALYSRLTGVKYEEPPFCGTSPLLKALLPFFSDLLTSEIFSPPQLQPQFLIRAIGIKPQLLPHLNKIPCSNVRIKLLIQKLLSRSSSNPHQELPVSLMKAEDDYHYFRVLERTLLTMEEDPGKDEPENLQERFFMISKLATFYSVKEEWAAYAGYLKRASQLLALLGQTLKARYLGWIEQLMAAEEDEIPHQTEDCGCGIFSGKLLDWQYDLILNILSLCLRRPRYKSAWYLSVVLLGKLPYQTPPDSIVQEQLVTNLENIIENTTGLRRVCITTPYLNVLKSLGYFRKMVEFCSNLITQVKQKDYQIFLICLETTGRELLGDVKGALHCNEQLLKLGNQFQLKPEFIRSILASKAGLQQRLKQHQNALATNMEIMRMLENDGEELIKQAIITKLKISLNLSHLDRFEEKSLIWEDTVRMLLLIEPHDPILPSVLEKFTETMFEYAQSGRLMRFLSHSTQITSLIARFLPNSHLPRQRKIKSMVQLYGIYCFTRNQQESRKTVKLVLQLIADYYLHEQSITAPTHQQISAMTAKFITSPLTIFEFEPLVLERNKVSSQRAIFFSNHYVTLLYYFLFNSSPQQAISLVNAYSRLNQSSEGHIAGLITWCIKQEYYEVVIVLTSTHKAVSQKDWQFCRGYSLYKLDRHEEAAVLLQFFLANCHERKRERVNAYLALSEIAAHGHLLPEESRSFVEKAKLILADLLAKRPDKPEFCLNMGICEAKLQRYDIALQWLEKVQRSKETDLMKECNLLYGVSLNKLKQHKRAVYYLRKGDSRIGLFYLVHSLFVLRRKFKKPTAKLLATDVKGQYNGYLMEFLGKYSPKDYFVIFQAAVTPEQEEQTKKLFQQPRFITTQIRQTIKLTILRKRIARFLISVRSQIIKIGEGSISQSQRVNAINQQLRHRHLYR